MLRREMTLSGSDTCRDVIIVGGVSIRDVAPEDWGAKVRT